MGAFTYSMTLRGAVVKLLTFVDFGVFLGVLAFG